MEIKMVGICGCGLMGSGIAEVVSKAGMKVVIREVNDDFLKKGLGRIEKSLARAVEKGKLEEAGKMDVLSRIKGTTNLKELADCDIRSWIIWLKKRRFSPRIHPRFLLPKWARRQNAPVNFAVFTFSIRFRL
jgi:hypothetical protein